MMLQQINCLKAGNYPMARRPKPEGLKYLRKTAKGRVYYYHPNGTRLCGEPGTQEFVQNWIDARANSPEPSSRTLTALVDAFELSPAFIKLSQSTKTEWVRWFNRYREWFDGMPLKAVESPKFLDVFEARREEWTDRPHSADYALKVFNRLLTWGKNRGWVQRGPLPLERWASEDRAGMIWTQDQLAQLLSKCDPEPKKGVKSGSINRSLGLIIRFAALTGWRQGDILALTWGDLDAGGRISTRKSKGRLGAALIETKALKDLIKSIPRDPEQVFVFPNKLGQRWDAKGFRAAFIRARKRAGLDDTGLRFHDLRGTFVGHAVQAGIPLEEVARFIGWSPTRAARIATAYVGKDVRAEAYARAIDAKIENSLENQSHHGFTEGEGI
jgi:integrase